MTAVVESDLNPIDCDVPLLRSNSFVPSERRLSVDCYPIEPSADVRKMPNTQLLANSRSLSQLADKKRPTHVFSCNRLIR